MPMAGIKLCDLLLTSVMSAKRFSNGLIP